MSKLAVADFDLSLLAMKPRRTRAALIAPLATNGKLPSVYAFARFAREGVGSNAVAPRCWAIDSIRTAVCGEINLLHAAGPAYLAPIT